MQRHRYSFFGQKTALFLDSGNSTEGSIYIRFIKKLPSGAWEKPSQKEGKSFKFNLLELAEIRMLLQQDHGKWSTVHRFQGKNSPINFIREDNRLQIFTQGYSKALSRAEVMIFTDLLSHIYEEKIRFSTGITATNIGPPTDTSRNSSRQNLEIHYNSNSTENTNATVDNEAPLKNPRPTQKVPAKANRAQDHSTQPRPKSRNPPQLGVVQGQQATNLPAEWLKTLEKDRDYFLLPGKVVQRRERALNFAIEGQSPIWIPLSQVKASQNSSEESIWVKQWFIKTKLPEIFVS